MEFADKLLMYKGKRAELLAIIEDAHRQAGLKHPFMENGQPFEDICPFTVFGAFNKGITTENRIAIMKALADHINIQRPVPSNFDGIPVLNNMNAWFFGYKADRQPEDIDNLWHIFESAINLADNPTESNRQTFVSQFNTVLKQQGIKWNITIGLYWIRPNHFLNLDGRNRQFLLESDEASSIGIGQEANLNQLPDAENYLQLVEQCKKSFLDDKLPFHSFPELSQAAWLTTIDKKTEQEVDSSKAKFEPCEKRVWMYAPGSGAKNWEEFYSKSIMGIGWDGLGDLTAYSDRESVRTKMKEIGDETKSYRNDSLALWQFAHAIRVGDVVFVKKGVNEIIGRGIVKSDYEFKSERNDKKHIRIITWTDKGSWKHPGQAVLKTLTDITNYTEYVQKLERLVSEDAAIEFNESEEEQTYEVYSEDYFLNEVFMNPEQYKTIADLLKIKKNIILQGAPGVGKTFAAKRLAYSMIGTKDTSRVVMVQFHQSYSYEDFIMGFRPVKDGFELTYGPFYDFCKKAQDDIRRDYFFIIDEINRGNLSKIFGELLMLVENDKRGEKEKLRLLYANEFFFVPKNVYIIGLMNTADRSLAMIDYALRRRFAFYDMEPAFNSYGFQKNVERRNNAKLINLIELVKKLNEEISQDESLGDGFRIGHSYFCTDDEITDSWLSYVVNFEILPLLREYWFDEKEKLEVWTKKLRGAL